MPGAVLDQNQRHIRRLNIVVEELEKWRNEELEKEVKKVE
jgi:hypothetical protein